MYMILIYISMYGLEKVHFSAHPCIPSGEEVTASSFQVKLMVM